MLAHTREVFPFRVSALLGQICTAQLPKIKILDLIWRLIRHSAQQLKVRKFCTRHWSTSPPARSSKTQICTRALVFEPWTRTMRCNCTFFAFFSQKSAKMPKFQTAALRPVLQWEMRAGTLNKSPAPLRSTLKIDFVVRSQTICV